MSIPNIFNKIKGLGAIDRMTILYVVIVIGVGVGSFGLGRLSVINTTKLTEDKVSIVSGPLSSKSSQSRVTTSNNTPSSSLGFVASKNGKIYYTPSCAGAKRIKEENKVWFTSTEEAKNAGYSPSSCL